jgi:ubiquinone/menaquinone biosynthesis C-methylase UbiE
MRIHGRWRRYIDQQHRYPTGLIGRGIGERMVRQHAPETQWSIDLLDVRPGDRVLELGCGAGCGLLLASARANAGHVIGLDLSRAMLRSAARRNDAARRTGHLDLIRADLTALPIAAQRVNKIVSIHTLYFWPDPLAVFTDLSRVLTPGGTVVITFATAETRSSGERVVWPLQARAEQLVAQLQQQGFAVHLAHGPDSRQYNNVAIVLRS